MNNYLKACDKLQKIANICDDQWVIDILLKGRDKIKNRALSQGVFVKNASESRIKIINHKEQEAQEAQEKE